MQRNNFLIFFILLVLVLVAGQGSFWTGVFSVLKFIVILVSLIVITIAIKIFMFYRNIKKQASSMGEDPRYGFPGGIKYVFYKRGFSTNPNTNQQGSSYYSQRREQFRVPKQQKTIEICPKCGYEKGENHVCPR